MPSPPRYAPAPWRYNRAIPAVAAAGNSVLIQFGRFAPHELIRAFTMYIVPSATPGASDQISLLWGFFNRPPATLAEFLATHNLGIAGGTASFPGLLTVYVMPVNSPPPADTPHFAVVITNAMAAANIDAGQVGLWIDNIPIEGDSRRAYLPS